jgi:hypothetical protein
VAQSHGTDSGLIEQCFTVAGMAFPRESVKQHRGVIPRRVRVVARVLRCMSIKCLYTGAGVGTTCVQVPSSEAVLAEGAFIPRARRTSPEGAFIPQARRTPPEGAFSPQARRTSLEGRPPCRPSGPQGPPGLQSCCARVLGSWVSSCFALFASFKRVSPGYFRGPSWLSPIVAPKHLRVYPSGSRRC